VCEYWCLQDGSRGVIGFDALNMKKIREQIDKVIRGLLAGEWPRGGKCQGDDQACSIFDTQPHAFSDRVLGES
jgi:hypothetical protein